MALTLRINMLNIVKSISNDSQFLNAFIPFIRQEGLKQEFGARYIDKILERLDDGKGKEGKFTGRAGKYSKQYIKSEAFRAYGKDPDTVNLKLSGSMRADISVVDTYTTGVIIGFIDPEQEQKALGHIRGRRKLPKRDFWGLPKQEEEKLMKEVIREFKDNNLDTVSFEQTNNQENLTEQETIKILETNIEDQQVDFFIEDFDNG